MGANLILPAGSAAAEEAAFSVDYSCRFDDSSSTKLERENGEGDLNTFTISFWMKRGTLSGVRQQLFTSSNTGGSIYFFAEIFTDDKFRWGLNDGGSPGDCLLSSTRVLRDPSAWYHIVLAVDTSAGVASANKMRLYINGVEETQTGTALTVDDYTVQWNAANYHQWIGAFPNGTLYFDGYLADIISIDGSQLTPTSFAETDDNGQWVPKEYTGSHGDEGFHLDFASAGTTSGSNTGLGKDVSGNENYFTTSNLGSEDQVIDTPAAGKNYCTINPLEDIQGSVSEGNLLLTTSSTSGSNFVPGTMGVGYGSGKWYFEVRVHSSTGVGLGIGPGGSADYSGHGSTIGLMQNGSANSQVYNTGSSTQTLASASSGDVLSAAIDLSGTNRTIQFYKNGSTFGTSETIPDTWSIILPYVGGGSVVDNNYVNFGQDPTFSGNRSTTPATTEFAYTPPTGFKSLCTANLPDPGVNNAVDSEQAFEVITYEGTETEHTIPHSGTSPTSMSFNPDLIWVKNRSNATGYHHGIADTVRGISSSSTPLLSSSSDGAEYDTSAQIEGVSSNQITLGDNSDSANYVNLDDDDYVAWAWKAGTGFSSTNGGDTTSGSKNADAGFSIVTWSGDDWNYDNGEYPEGETKSIYHGLGAAPELIIAKSLSNNASSFLDDEYGATYDSAWVVWTKDLSANTHLELDSASAAISTASGTYPDPIQSVGATTFGASNAFDDSNYVGYFLNFGEEENGYYYGDSYVAYCFRSIEGYSKVGSYTGNGLDNGPFVHLGFRPAFILIKNADANNNGWLMFDSTRSPHNAVGEYLIANSSADESDFDRIDFVSNGFKLRENYTGDNSSSTDYIFYAVAENPFKHANAR